MQLNPLDAATLAALPTGAGTTARVLAGNLAAVPVGELLNAVVSSVSPREAVLTVNGQPLTVRPPAGPPLQVGAAVLVRVPPTAATAPNPTIELAVPPNPPPTAPLNPLPNPNPKAAPGVATRAPETTARPGVSGEVASVPTRAPTSVRPDVPALPPPRLAVVDVLAPMPDGRVRVQLDGVEQVATAAEPLAPGGRYVLQVERSPVGIKLSSPPPTAAQPTEVATAVLRTPAPTLPAALKPLQTELAALAKPQAPASPAVPQTVREAAVAVEATLRTFVPAESRPPDATQLRQLVENGGLHFEAKLARQIEGTGASISEGPTFDVGPESPARQPQSAKPSTQTPTAEKLSPGPSDKGSAASTSPSPSEPKAATAQVEAREPKPIAALPESGDLTKAQAAKVETSREPDLKGDLLRLLQAVNDLGGNLRAPAAEAAVRGIEAQQAANVLAQASGTPYFLQVPFPDGGEWRTLRLSLEPQHRPDQTDAERAGRFRVFMHVPLTDLGETWIDAGLSGERFRATIYLDQAAVRDRVRAALPDLHTELAAEGFSEVLLDVRSSGELPESRRRAAGSVQAGRPDAVSVLDVRA